MYWMPCVITAVCTQFVNIDVLLCNILFFYQLIQLVEKDLVEFRSCVNSIGTHDSTTKKQELSQLEFDIKAKLESAKQELDSKRYHYVCTVYVCMCVYVCVCVCMYVCMFVCMYVRMYVQMYAYV